MNTVRSEAGAIFQVSRRVQLAVILQRMDASALAESALPVGADLEDLMLDLAHNSILSYLGC